MESETRPATAAPAETGAMDRIVSPGEGNRQPHVVMFRRWAAASPAWSPTATAGWSSPARCEQSTPPSRWGSWPWPPG